jgi:hypothetical protein
MSFPMNPAQSENQANVALVDLKRKAALKVMLTGGLVCGIGLLITIGTYAAASDGGGTYFIMWGPVIFGAIQFFKGLGQLASAGK